MTNIKTSFGRISERSMDLMFLNLFVEDSAFVYLFLREAGIETNNYTIESVELSKTDTHLGESDITVVLSNGNKKLAILIEDKIDAIDMPEQPQRYIARGNKAVEEGKYDSFESFIVCPQKYYDNNDAARLYPHLLTYETIRDYLSGKDGPLFIAWHQQISGAIEKAKKPPQVTINADANAFFRKYKRFQEVYYPSLNLRTKSESNGYWAKYRTHLKGVSVHHKLQEGKVDMAFRNAADKIKEGERLAEWLRNHGIVEASFERQGKSGAIVIKVPPLKMHDNFEDTDEETIRRCLDAVKDLVDAANAFALVEGLRNTAG